MFDRILRCLAAAFVLVAALAVADRAAAQSGYRISAGDQLRIEVLEDPNLSRDVLVLPDGSISFPLVGTLRAGGRTIDQVRSTLAARLAPNFATDPTVFVSVGALADSLSQMPSEPVPEPTISAFIMGEVANPGKVEITPGTTLLQFLAQAGGLTEFAAERRIELRRTHPRTGAVTTYLFSYTGAAKGPRIRGSTVIAPGDVVVVPQRRLFE